MKFSLVIPCYNEHKNIPLLLERCKKVVALGDIEVILVDNGSTDDTPAVLNSLLPKYIGCRSIRVETNRGYGFGILSGLSVANGEVLGWTHADMQTDPYDVAKAVELFNKYGSNCFVKGRRYGRPLADTLFTVGMSIYETILLRRTLWDINAQPTMFSRDLYEKWIAPPEDFSLDLYAYFTAYKYNARIKRFNVLFGKRAHGLSNWNVSWSSKLKFIRRTLEFSNRLKKSLVE